MGFSAEPSHPGLVRCVLLQGHQEQVGTWTELPATLHVPVRPRNSVFVYIWVVLGSHNSPDMD